MDRVYPDPEVADLHVGGASDPLESGVPRVPGGLTMPASDIGSAGACSRHLVGEIMSHHVVTVGLDATLRDVRALFDRFHFHHVLVVDPPSAQGAVMGVISDRDLLRHTSPRLGTVNERDEDRRTLERKAHQVMTRDLISVRPETPVDEAGQLMLSRHIHSLPVIDGSGRCVGIVTTSDVLRWCLHGQCKVA
jgi:acetoin utilization protein AcuB